LIALKMPRRYYRRLLATAASGHTDAFQSVYKDRKVSQAAYSEEVRLRTKAQFWRFFTVIFQHSALCIVSQTVLTVFFKTQLCAFHSLLKVFLKTTWFTDQATTTEVAAATDPATATGAAAVAIIQEADAADKPRTATALTETMIAPHDKTPTAG
jgi:hypothetical protein